MCGAILWLGQQDDLTTLQSIYSMYRWPPLQRRRNKICWRIVKYMLSNCSAMLILGKNWTTWYFMVSKQARTIHNKMDQSLWQTPESIDFLYSSYMWIQTYCHVRNTAKQCRLGMFQDSDSKSISGGTLFIFGSHTFVLISWMCKKQISVSHSSAESEIISFAHWTEISRAACSGVLGSNCFCFLEAWPRLQTERATCWYWKKSKISREGQRAKEYWLCSFKRSVFASRSFVVCVRRQWSSDQDDH